MRQIAIVGIGNSDFDAPWQDPAWEVWALPWHAYAYHAKRLFEMHDLKLLLTEPACKRGCDEYLARLLDVSEGGIPIYMQRQWDDLPTSVAYPLDEVVATLRRDYFGSSPAYPIALAIHERVDRIGLWGVDLKEDGYDHQRYNLEWLLGFAEAKGIDVFVHPDSKLFTLKKNDHIGDCLVNYPVRYGWLA